VIAGGESRPPAGPNEFRVTRLADCRLNSCPRIDYSCERATAATRAIQGTTSCADVTSDGCVPIAIEISERFEERCDALGLWKQRGGGGGGVQITNHVVKAGLRAKIVSIRMLACGSRLSGRPCEARVLNSVATPEARNGSRTRLHSMRDKVTAQEINVRPPLSLLKGDDAARPDGSWRERTTATGSGTTADEAANGCVKEFAALELRGGGYITAKTKCSSNQLRGARLCNLYGIRVALDDEHLASETNKRATAWRHSHSGASSRTRWPAEIPASGKPLRKWIERSRLTDQTASSASE